MQPTRCVWIGLAALAIASRTAPAHADAPRLFDGHELIEIAIEADWDPIRRDDTPEPAQHPATLSYVGPNGDVRIPVKIAASGRSRRTQDICELPPLRLDLPKQERKGTLFRGIGEFKLVTHCRNQSKYEQYLLLEYLVYRSYGLITDQSHRVRLLRVSYREPGRAKPRWQRHGFAIEDAEDLAERVGAERVAESEIERARLDPAAASRAELFFYMIGMTDFSLVKRQGGPCCHNARALRGADGSVVPVPYDFDQTGVVNAEYAAPDARLGIRSVTQRKFRGQCRPPEATAATLTALREQRAAIRALFESPAGLPRARARRALAYLDGFYEWADDAERVAKTLAADCAEAAR
ncbi:MAG TPA: hypothetical protein VFT98_08880 [Myxococcota bacterium]|nr:hypothetical protein [Myxococcota bacterium]